MCIHSDTENPVDKIPRSPCFLSIGNSQLLPAVLDEDKASTPVCVLNITSVPYYCV